MDTTKNTAINPEDFTSDWSFKFIDMKKLWELLQSALQGSVFPGYFSPTEFEILNADKTKKVILHKKTYRRNDDTLFVSLLVQCNPGDEPKLGHGDFTSYPSKKDSNVSDEFVRLTAGEFPYTEISSKICIVKKFLS